MNINTVQNIELEITANCNAECPICARTNLGMPLSGNTELTLSDIKSIFHSRELTEDKDISLCGTLGDPIVNPECLEIVRYLSEMGAYVSMSTNGGYRTEAWWAELANIPRVFVTFAVDGFENTNHIYRVNVAWKVVERNMRAYATAGGKGSWAYVVFEHNEDDVTKAQSLASELGFRFVIRTGGRNELSVGKVHTPRKSNQVIINTSKKYSHGENIDAYRELVSVMKDNDIQKMIDAIPTISCRHLNERYIFIASDKTLWHCCYLYTKYSFGSLHLFKNVDPDWNNLDKHTIPEILAHKNFGEIQQMWHPHHERYVPSCMFTCGAHGAYLDKNHA